MRCSLAFVLAKSTKKLRRQLFRLAIENVHRHAQRSAKLFDFIVIADEHGVSDERVCAACR